MKTPDLPRRSVSLAALLVTAGAMMLAAPPAPAQGLSVGSIVSTNFGLVNRFRWTNDNGQVYTASNTTLRLHDFAGKILFIEFFAVW